MTGAGSAPPEAITVVQDAAGCGLTKSFSWRGGKLVKQTYPNAAEFRAYDAAARDAAFDDLLQQIGAVLEADRTLGGLAFGMTYGRPETSIEAVAGAPAIKSATLSVTVDYESDAPLS